MEEEEDEAATVVVVEEEEDEEVEEEEEEVWEGKESSCPVSEERREQERRSTVCREGQRRSNGMHCSVTFAQPARLMWVRLSLRGEMGEVRVCTVWSVMFPQWLRSNLLR